MPMTLRFHAAALLLAVVAAPACALIAGLGDYRHVATGGSGGSAGSGTGGSGGVSACPTGTERCGGACVSTADAGQNCGKCGHACAAAEVCVAGACCASVCTGKCVDLQTDGSNCGKCGVGCQANEACIAGACNPCAAGQTPCSNGCKDLQSDSSNCSACGRSCGSEACADGLCNPHHLNEVTDGVAAIVIDRAKSPNILYWVGDGASSGTMVGRLDLTSFTAGKLASTTTGINQIAIDGAGLVYWIEGVGTTGVKVVKSVTDDTKLVVTTYASTATTANATSVAATPTEVYWTAFGNPGTVFRLPVSNPTGMPAVIAPAPPSAMFGAPAGAVVGSSKLFFISSGIPRVYSVPLAGVGETLLAMTSGTPTALQLVADVPYWADQNGDVNTLMGTSQKPLVMRPNTTISQLAADASGLYWIEPTKGTGTNGVLMKAALDGSGVTTLAAGLDYPLSIALDADFVYYVDQSQIFTVPK